PQYDITNGNVGGTGAASPAYVSSASISASANTRTGPRSMTTFWVPVVCPFSSVSATCRLLFDPSVDRSASGRLQMVLHHLAGRVARQLVDEAHLARALVVGEPILTELEQALGGQRRAVPDDDPRGDVLAEHGMGHAGHRGLAHVGVLEEHGFDVRRVDVVAAADDHVLLAPADVEEAVLVEVR